MAKTHVSCVEFPDNKLIQKNGHTTPKSASPAPTFIRLFICRSFEGMVIYRNNSGERKGISCCSQGVSCKFILLCFFFACSLCSWIRYVAKYSSPNRITLHLLFQKLF